MNLISFPGSQARSQATPAASLIHAECPLEQVVRSDDAETQTAPLREPWSQTRREGVLVVGDCNGLRLLGRSEGALDAAVEPLRRRFGARLVVDPPTVRYAVGIPTLEPWMSVLATGPGHCLPQVRTDFSRRGGRITQLRQASSFLLEGEAPLAQLLGYAQWLRELTATADASLSLSRYLPVIDDVPGAA
jgi:hypothetical protein